MADIRMYVPELEYLITFLYQLELMDYESRMRTRLLKILIDRQKLFLEDKEAIIAAHAHQDEQGEPQSSEVDGKLYYDIKDEAAVRAALEPFYQEEFIIELNDNNRPMIESVRESILHCGLKFSGDEQFQYGRICDIFEGNNH